jgi:hypothetical protein
VAREKVNAQCHNSVLYPRTIDRSVADCDRHRLRNFLDAPGSDRRDSEHRRKSGHCSYGVDANIKSLAGVAIAFGTMVDMDRLMAWPVFGGMVVAMLTLFVVPVVFCGFKELKMNLGIFDRHWAGTEPSAAEVADGEDVSGSSSDRTT